MTALSDSYITIEPQSLPELLTAFTAQTVDDLSRRYAWRGHGDAGWPLHSGIYRRLADFGVSGGSPTEADVRAHEEDLMKRAIAAGYNRGRTHAESYALLQHRGAATRFLDISWDPLVALWFATEERRDVDAAVFAIDVTDAQYVDPVSDEGWRSFADGLASTQIGVYQPSWDDVRIKAQRGAFIYGRVDHETESEPATHVRYIVPRGLRQEALAYLDGHLNISAETIYPDFEGFARANGAGQKPRDASALAAFPKS